MPKTIEELMNQTRPVLKGNRVRGKSSKRRGSKNKGKISGYDPMQGLAARGTIRSSYLASAMQAKSQGEALRYLRQQQRMSNVDRSNAFGQLLGQQGLGSLGSLGGLI
jgi:hypothetical protein